MNATDKDAESVTGDECHIVSGKPGGPRYEPSFPEEELDSYSNLVLLCRVHHKMVDDQPRSFTAEVLRQLRASHEAWVSQTLQSTPVAPESSESDSLQRTFDRIFSMMPELIAEMKADLCTPGQQFIREFFVVSKHWVMNVSAPSFLYYFEDHANLQGKIHILENCDFVRDVTPGNAKKYRMSEEFVDMVLRT